MPVVPPPSQLAPWFCSVLTLVLVYTRASQELAILMDHFDTDKSGGVSLTEFTRALRGDLNKRRQALVNKAFARLDTDGSGVVTVDDLATVYDVSSHPGVADGRVTVKEALKEFLGGWEGQDKDGMVTLKEFSDYYADLSASIDSDDYCTSVHVLVALAFCCRVWQLFPARQLPPHPSLFGCCITQFRP